MPPKSKKPCAAPRCPHLTREKYCQQHAHLVRDLAAQRDAQYDRLHRDPQITEFYKSAAWRAARLAALRRDRYLCVPCLKDRRFTPAVIVHHIVELDVAGEGWDLRLYVNNLMSVCRGCHNEIHKRVNA